MAKKHVFDAGIDLKKSEIANAALQNLFIFPSSPSLGQILFRSDLNLGAYWDGTVWLYFGLSENVLAALNAANSPDETNPFLTLDDLPVLVEDFIDLFDVPNAYTGAGLKTVRVKATEDGLEFFLIVGIPPGGSTGQVLGKASAADYHVSWIDQTGGGGGGGGLNPLDTFPVLKFDKNYIFEYEMVGAIEISIEEIDPAPIVGNKNIIYIKADGVNKPTFTGQFSITWDNWVNSAGFWNRCFVEWSPEIVGVTQIENAHQGATNSGTGATEIVLTFDADAVVSHVITGSTEIILDPTDAEVGKRSLLYIKANGVDKPFWNSDLIVTYDGYKNEADTWNRFWVEWRPENKALAHIIYS